MIRIKDLCSVSLFLCAGSATWAQPFDVTWHAITAGGATTPGEAGAFTIRCTVGEPLAVAPAGSGRFSIDTGFIDAGGGGGGGGPPPCYANCDHSTAPPILNVNDFICFLTQFAAASPYANCDESTTPPTLNVNDFICFQQRFAAGCP